MQLSLFGISSKSERITITNNGSNRIVNDSDTGIVDNAARIANGTTIEEVIKDDRGLMIFLMILGFYIRDHRNSIWITIIARFWQFILLIFGGIGFVWRTFIHGGLQIKYLHDVLSNETFGSSEVAFIAWGYVAYYFLVPLTQVTSLIFGIFKVYTESRLQEVEENVLLRHLATSKRDAIIFFIFMTLEVITIDPFSMTSEMYRLSQADFDDQYFADQHLHQEKYSLFVFDQFVSKMFLNLSVTCYLTVMVFLLSLIMKQVKTIQQYIVDLIETSTLSARNYNHAKDRIINLIKASYFPTELLMLTAGLNIMGFLFIIWLLKSLNKNYQLNKSLMWYKVADQLPYLLKGIHISTTLIINIINIFNIKRDRVLLLYSKNNSINKHPS